MKMKKKERNEQRLIYSGCILLCFNSWLIFGSGFELSPIVHRAAGAGFFIGLIVLAAGLILTVVNMEEWKKEMENKWPGEK